jgi:hypothetical protein
MKAHRNSQLLVFFIVLSLAGGGDRLHGEPAESAKTEANAEVRVPVGMAREKAKLMHNVYSATLDAMHHYYFHANKAVIPARAMEDVFADVAHRSHATARWISVNTKAMSIDHEPNTDFEKKAAAELSAGKEEFEIVDKGWYRRASPIPLNGGCIGCHTDSFSKRSNAPRYAGLVISIPVNDE